MLARLLAFALLFLFSGSLAARTSKTLPQYDGCRDIDLNADANSPLRKIPVYDQGNTNMCYAYTASQLIDFYRFKNGDKSYDFTNPIYAGWSYKTKHHDIANRKSLDFGNSGDLILALRENGVCTNSEVQARLSVLAKSANLSETELVEMLERSYTDDGWLKEHARRIFGIRPPPSKSCTQPQALKDQLQRYHLLGIASTAALKPLLQNCRKIPLNVPEPKTYLNDDDESFGRNIESTLSAGYPGGIGYCSQILEDQEFLGTTRLEPSKLRSGTSECFKHLSVITGQKNFAGHCHYLIRNTGGPQHREGAANSCACITASGKYETSCSERNPKQIVGCWIPRGRVLKNSYNLVILK